MIRKKSSFKGVTTTNIVLHEKYTLDGKTVYIFNPDYVKLCRYALDNNDTTRMTKKQREFFNDYIKAMNKKLENMSNEEEDEKDVNTDIKDIFIQFDELLAHVEK